MKTNGSAYLITLGWVNSIGCRFASGIITGELKMAGNVIGNEGARPAAIKNIRPYPSLYAACNDVRVAPVSS